MENINSIIAIICYKYHYTLDYVLSLSVPQLYYLQDQLFKIMKLENGETEDKKSTPIPVDNADQNTLVLGATLEHLKKVCKRDSFTLLELQNPSETIKFYTQQN